MSNMSINIRGSSMVIPAEETPKGALWLTDMDLMKGTPSGHFPLVYIYESSPQSTKHFDTTLLKAALSKVLVPFYPVAGRLSKNNENGRIEIDCNTKGLLFVEADTTYELSHFGEFTPNAELRKMVIPTCDYSKGLDSIPLLMVQLTRFRCGGVSLGFAVHHFVLDASSVTHFINSWSRLARGIEIDVPPVLDRTRLLVPRNPPQVKFDHLEFQPIPSAPLGEPHITEPTIVGLSKFSRGQIAALKLKATSLGKNYSTYEMLAGHILRCTCKARGLNHDQDIKVSIPVNGRSSRFSKSVVPQAYIGNATFYSTIVAKAGEIATKPVWYAASKVHEAVTRVDEEYMLSAVDYLSLQPDLTALASKAYTDLYINYWARFIPFYEADFGCGKPVLVRHGGMKWEGQVVISPSSNGDDLYVAICLLTSHMDRFEKLIHDFDDI